MDYTQIDRSIFKNSAPEFIYTEGQDHKGRGKFEMALSGIGWVMGGAFAVGCARGAIGEFLNPDTRQLSMKPWLTRMINGTMKYGSGYAQPAGTLMVYYSALNILLGSIRAEDDINSIGAGALAGALYRSPYGLKPMLKAGGAGALIGLLALIVQTDSRMRIRETLLG
uniref:Mitochondrial import inner membrane translocase subunit TIM23 n=1 Tax=Parastrongyloides trichosuri TaxID=131310 RepID=A0A0N4ZYY0_PARTI